MDLVHTRKSFRISRSLFNNLRDFNETVTYMLINLYIVSIYVMLIKTSFMFLCIVSFNKKNSNFYKSRLLNY